MNRVTIQKTIDRLMAIAGDEALRRQFDLNTWGNDSAVHAVTEQENPACGFAGCFIGWAIHQQWYAEDGLVLGFTEGLFQDWRGDERRTDWTPCILPSSDERFSVPRTEARRDAMIALRAVGHVLGISSTTVSTLVYAEEYADHATVGPEHVAARLQTILDIGEAEAVRIFRSEAMDGVMETNDAERDSWDSYSQQR